MAEKRMFALTIVDSDAFLDMPLSTQALYFHLCMRADDEGFINNPKKIQRAINATDDDMRILMAKNFVITFDSGIIVIKHWLVNNHIRGDRAKRTVYAEERSLLAVKESGAYTFKCCQEADVLQPVDNQLTTNCQPVDNQVSTKRQPTGGQVVAKCPHSIEEYSIDKNSIEEDSIEEENGSSGDEPPSAESRPKKNNINDVIEGLVAAYSAACPTLPQVRKVTEKRKKAIENALKQYTVDELKEVFRLAGKSSFLTGRSERGWKAGFDWLINPANTIKVLEGNYANRTPVNPNNRFHNFDQRNVNYDELLAGELGSRKWRKD